MLLRLKISHLRHATLFGVCSLQFAVCRLKNSAAHNGETMEGTSRQHASNNILSDSEYEHLSILESINLLKEREEATSRVDRSTSTRTTDNSVSPRKLKTSYTTGKSTTAKKTPQRSARKRKRSLNSDGSDDEDYKPTKHASIGAGFQITRSLRPSRRAGTTATTCFYENDTDVEKRSSTHSEESNNGIIKLSGTYSSDSDIFSEDDETRARQRNTTDDKETLTQSESNTVADSDGLSSFVSSGNKDLNEANNNTSQKSGFDINIKNDITHGVDDDDSEENNPLQDSVSRSQLPTGEIYVLFIVHKFYLDC